MRKFLKLALKLILGLLLLMTIAVWVLLDPVDFTPYFRTAYYQTTLERLDSVIASTQLSEGRLRVGMARLNITPGRGRNLTGPGKVAAIPLAGYGAREGQPARGVHDSLYIKAVALQVDSSLLVLIGADMLIVPPHVAAAVDQRLQERTRIRRHQVFYSATHTHSGLGGWAPNYVGEAFGGEVNQEIINWLVGQFASAIEMAVADLQPGQIGYDQFEAPDLVQNRLVGPLGQEHSTVTFIEVRQLAGQQGLIGIFDAHATTLGADNLDFSADYPAYWYRTLEAAGIDLAVFCAGGVGSHGPESKGLAGFAEAQYIGEQLAERVLRRRAALSFRDTVKMASISLPVELPTLQVRVSDGLALAPFAARRLFPPMGQVYLQSARVDELLLTTTPADFSGELAVRIQDRLQRQGFRSVITSFNGAYVGYALPGKYYHLDEYESRIMSWFGPYLGPYLEDLIDRITGALIGLDQ